MKLEISRFAALGLRDAPLRHTWIRQEQARHLTIVLPDITPEPRTVLLSFPVNQLVIRGLDVVWLELPYDRRQDFHDMPPARRQRWVFADVEAAFTAAAHLRPYERVTLLAKSSGTQAAWYLIRAAEPGSIQDVVWISSQLDQAQLTHLLDRYQVRSLFVMGSQDPNCTPALINALGSREVPLLLVPGADHNLEVQGDLKGSLEATDRMGEAVVDFLTTASAGEARD